MIALLLVAAAGTAFYLLNRKNKPGQNNSLNKELVSGKWKTVLNEPSDSAAVRYGYEFQNGGLLLRTTADTLKADILHYAWNQSGALVWKEKPADTTGITYTVIKLTADSLELKTEQPASRIVLIKTK